MNSDNIIAFPTREEMLLRAAIDLDEQLKPFDVRTRCEARNRAARLVASGMHPQDATRRVIAWTRCCIDPNTQGAA